MMNPQLQHIDNENEIELAIIKLERVTYHDESGAAFVEDASLEVKPGEHVAIVGDNNSGKEGIVGLMTRLVLPLSGIFRYGDRDLLDFCESITGRRFAYLGDETYLLPISLEDNLLYGLKHRPLREAVYEGTDLDNYQTRLYETKRAGNPHHDFFADWIDYEGAGVADRVALEARIRDLLVAVEFEEDVYQFGLRGRIDSKNQNDLAEHFLQREMLFAHGLQNPGLQA